MSFDFVTATDDLEALLSEAFPGWRVLDAFAPQPTNVLVPVLTYTQTDISPEWPGAGVLADDFYAVSVALELTAPGTDQAKANATLLRLLPKLYAVLREIPDLEFSTAKRGVTDAGATFYQIPLTLLTYYSEEE